MRVVLTGSSGRIGRAIFAALIGEHSVIGIDRVPFATTRLIGDLTDKAFLEQAVDGADAIIHTAGPHAPHVGVVRDREFHRINVDGTRLIAEVARAAGVRRIVYTSTTALYGDAIKEERCTWIDEEVVPKPRNIYHRTKLAAEKLLADVADERLVVRILRMSRCFPEPANLMAVYRLHRGVDARDVADAHCLALTNEGSPFDRYIISGATPFSKADCPSLATDAPSVMREIAPDLVAEFEARGWRLPAGVDRVYASSAAEHSLGWKARYGFSEVLAQLDRRSLEVLPAGAVLSPRNQREGAGKGCR